MTGRLRVKSLASAIAEIALSLMGASVLLLSFIAQAMAQEDEQNIFVIEEILVTATRREQSLQDVPISMTVFGSDELTNSGSVKLVNIASLVPNMSLNEAQTLGRTEFTVRGFSTFTGNLGLSPGVGIYIDEVYVGRDSGFNGDLADVERVEVLRGPQGTLYGRNTTMGAINVITKRPSEELGGAIEASVGNYDLRSVRGYVTGSLIEGSLAAKVSFSSRKRDGFLDNASGADLNDDDALSGRAQLLFTPADKMEFLWTVDASKNRPVGDYQITALGSLSHDDVTWDLDVTDVGFEKRDLFGTALRADVYFNDMTLTSITGYREIDFDNFTDKDFTNFDFISTRRREQQEQISQELRFASSDDDSLQWIAGGYYYHDNVSGGISAHNGADTIWLVIDPTLVGSGILPSVASGGTLSDDVIIAPESKVRTTSKAVFGSLTYDLDVQSSITAGVRYTKEEKELELIQDIYATDPTQTPIAQVIGAGSGFVPFVEVDELEDDAFSADLAYTLELSSDLTLYAKLAHGFKSGGFNAALTTTPAPGLPFDPELSFEPETVTSWELGWKVTLLAGSMRLNGAVFYADFRKKQEIVFDVGTGFSLSNAGEARSQGLEAEAQWIPLERLHLGLGFGYTDAEYKKFQLDATTDHSGNELANAPKVTLSVSADYSFPIANILDGVARLDISYQSDTYRDVANTEDFSTNEYVLVNLRLGVQSEDGEWSASIWGKNLLEQDRWTGASGSSTLDPRQLNYIPLNPRTFGLDVSYNF